MSGQTKKEIALTILLLAWSTAGLWLIKLTLEKPPTLLLVIIMAVFVLVWVALVAFAFATVRVASAVVVVCGIPVILAGIGGLRIGAVAAAVPVLAALAMARWRIRDQINDTLGFRPVRIFYAGVRWILLGILLAAAGLAVALVTTTMRAYVFKIPEGAIATALGPIEPLIAGTIPGGVAALIPLVTEVMNSYLNAVLHNSPLLSALAALVALLFVSRLLVSLAAWPALFLIIVLVFIARQTNVAYLVRHTVESSRLQLEEKDGG